MPDSPAAAVRSVRAEPHAALIESKRRVPRLVVALSIVGGLGLLVALGWLSRLERGGPAHVDLELPGGVPATFYYQGPATPFGLPPPPAAADRPPGVVLCHGFSADRAMMSALARRLALNGYAVLAIDARGHGENRNRFDGAGDGSGLYQEFATAVEYLRRSPHVDGSRIAVIGHSMGAGAALDYATREPGMTAAVMISGGFRTEGPHRPPNALFIYADGDPADLRQASDAIATRLGAGGGADDFAGLTAVRAAMVPGNDHLSILWSRQAAAEIVAWLDASFANGRRAPLDLSEPRLLAAAIAFASFLLVLPGIGWAVGLLAPAAAASAAGGAMARLGMLAVVLLASLPFSASQVMTSPLTLPVAQEVASLFLLSGTALLGGMALLGRIDLRQVARQCAAAVGPTAMGGIALAAAMTPLGVVLHRLGLTPERAVVALLLMLALLPLYLALEILLRRGSVLAAAAAGMAGRILVIAVLCAGMAAGLLNWVIALMLPVVVVIFLLGEILAFAIYAASANRFAIALIQAGWFAWLIAATMAIRL